MRRQGQGISQYDTFCLAAGDTKHTIVYRLSVPDDLEFQPRAALAARAALEPKWRECRCIQMHSRAHATDH